MTEYIRQLLERRLDHIIEELHEHFYCYETTRVPREHKYRPRVELMQLQINDPHVLYWCRYHTMAPLYRSATPHEGATVPVYTIERGR